MLMQRRPGWSLRRFAWLDSGCMYCDSLEVLLDEFDTFYAQMETRVLESTLVLFFVVLLAQRLVRQWMRVLRQFPGTSRRISILTSW